MHLNSGDIEKFTREAVQFFWVTRAQAEEKGKDSDHGGRAGATNGKNLDAFIQIFADLIAGLKLEGVVAGVEKRYVTLPGYLRPVKDWDLILTRHGELLAVIEFKSAPGPSYGNNYNNRTEEAMGSSIDIRTAMERGVFGDQAPFFLGWCILVEDSPRSRRPVRMAAPHFQPDREFLGASYLDRYEVFCRRLEAENFYSAAAVIASPKEEGRAWGAYSNLSEDTSFERFVYSFVDFLVNA